MNKNIIISSILASIIVAWIIGASASADDTSNTDNSSMKWAFERGVWDFKKGKDWFMKGITDEEKESLAEMTEEEKQEFFAQKRSERDAEMEAKKAERQAYETVIDKLLAGEILTSKEEVLRAEIIEKRAERKALRLEREAEMQEIKSIMDKKQEWVELTEEEQAKLDEMKANKKRGKKWHKGGHNHFDR